MSLHQGHKHVKVSILQRWLTSINLTSWSIVICVRSVIDSNGLNITPKCVMALKQDLSYQH
jgi:hypothetical protein